MKKISLSIISVSVIALFLSYSAGWVATAQDAKPTVQKWEYKVLPSRRGSASEDELNELGDKGWELVAVRSVGTAEAVFYFKRKKG